MYRMADRLWLLFWIPLTFTNGGGAAAAAAATRHTPEAKRETMMMMMMMHMAKISPRGALQAATAAATATGRRRPALAITVWIR